MGKGAAGGQDGRGGDASTRLLLARGLSGRALVVDPPDAESVGVMRAELGRGGDGNGLRALTFDVRQVAFAELHGSPAARDHAGAFDVALVYLPKGKARQRWVLDLAAQALRSEGELRVAGGKREGIRSIRDAVAERFATVLEITSGGHAQCIVARGPRVLADGGAGLERYASEAVLAVPGEPLTCMWYPGVYGADKLDEGSALLLGVLAAWVEAGELERVERVLDVGCGSGVLGAFVARAAAARGLLGAGRSLRVDLVDVDALALEAARATLRRAGLEMAEVSVFGSDVYSHVSGRYDWIISNPPFHEGVRTSYDAPERLIREAPKHLRPGGRLVLVANAFLPYRDALDQTFGGHAVLAETGRFRVYEARGR
ncbi:MAG: methyltransferase [Sandaracinaceae bacterium]|nr:methyltransferase [Sandaracinaceae bacterium]MBK7150545.1 methyltransferase [Sandaracinaceae bacterium]MBK8409318.1 methyltransferase [Sandaracinaceae bacterium]MBK8593245.1 methyltransferase [Sandaracinaceae bacterium]MBP7681668.1 methyltransferase [Deltaproteobacteria bacterium]